MQASCVLRNVTTDQKQLCLCSFALLLCFCFFAFYLISTFVWLKTAIATTTKLKTKHPPLVFWKCGFCLIYLDSVSLGVQGPLYSSPCLRDPTKILIIIEGEGEGIRIVYGNACVRSRSKSCKELEIIIPLSALMIL